MTGNEPAVPRSPNAALEILPSIAFTIGWLGFVLVAIYFKLPPTGINRERQWGFAVYHWTFLAMFIGLAYLILRGLSRDRVPIAPLRIDLPLSLIAGLLTYPFQALLFRIAFAVVRIDMAVMGILSLAAVALAALAVGRLGARWTKDASLT